MMPAIDGARMEARSKGLERCWDVRYQFCDLFAEITVYAVNEDEACARALDQLRLRLLKVA